MRVLSDKDKCLLGYLEATHKMWTWLAEHPEANKVESMGECIGESGGVWSNCFLCEYVSNTEGGYDKSFECLNCNLCPLLDIAWEFDGEFGSAPCQNTGSPYDNWEHAGSPEELRKAALAIAEGAQQAIYKLTKDKE